MQILNAENLMQFESIYKFKTFIPLRWTIFVCSYVFLHYQMCTILFQILKELKELKSVKYVFIAHLNTFGSNMFLAIKIMYFEDVVYTKFIYF